MAMNIIFQMFQMNLLLILVGFMVGMRDMGGDNFKSVANGFSIFVFFLIFLFFRVFWFLNRKKEDLQKGGRLLDAKTVLAILYFDLSEDEKI